MFGSNILTNQTWKQRHSSQNEGMKIFIADFLKKLYFQTIDIQSVKFDPNL